MHVACWRLLACTLAAGFASFSLCVMLLIYIVFIQMLVGKMSLYLVTVTSQISSLQTQKLTVDTSKFFKTAVTKRVVAVQPLS